MNEPAGRAVRRAHATFAAVAFVCVLGFGWMVTFGTFRFVAADDFGSFYDHQAASWLKGRWDVPEPALSGEAFIVEGKVYGYFGPTPALMRVPLVALGIGFAQVTRLFMLVDYLAALLGAYALLWLATRWRDPAAVPAGRNVFLFTATVGLGSTLFFLGSRAYVYHEAILCGAAFALWSAHGSLRWLQAPEGRAWIGALICGVLAVHARAPIGLFALTLLGVVALWHLCVRRPAFSRFAATAFPPKLAGTTSSGVARHVTIGALAALGIFSFNLVSYVKFGTFEGCPLRYNVQYTPEKMAVLGHRNFHPGNFRFNTDAYLLRPAFSVSPRFPYVYREYLDRRLYPESRMAYRDPTLAMPWSMPALSALAFLGSLLAAGITPAFRQPLGVLWASALPAALAMLTAVAVTQRYTADFVPFMIAAAAFAVASLAGLPSRIRSLVHVTAASLSVLGILVTLALTLHHQRHIVWGVPETVQREYAEWRTGVDRFFGVHP